MHGLRHRLIGGVEVARQKLPFLVKKQTTQVSLVGIFRHQIKMLIWSSCLFTTFVFAASRQNT
jgi:hypothetical protein